MYIAGDVRAVREYIDNVTSRLRSEMCLKGETTGEISSLALYAGWQLRKCTIRGLHDVSNVGNALPFIVEKPEPKHFDVATTLQVRKISFEAHYMRLRKGSLIVGTFFCGVVDFVRLEVVIGKSQGPGHLPKLDTCHVKEMGPVGFFGPVRFDGEMGILTDATEVFVRRCITDTITSRVAPVLADVLRTIPFPTFASEHE
ncbi:hypothetical protein MTO96_012876 [Rhipicephalus appendiculatus]